MKINIDISLIKIKHQKKTEKTEKTEEIEEIEENNENNEKKIKFYNFFSINEIKICNKIRKMPNYFDNYNIIIQNSFIKVGEMNEKALASINVINTKNNDEYLLFEYNYKKYMIFEDFLFNLPNPKLFIFHSLDSYYHLLNSLIKLQYNNICFFNLSSKNIIFDKSFKPLLRNFEKSLLINNITNKSYFISIIKEIDNFAYKPIEIHLLFYLIVNNEETLSSQLMEIICENYIKNMLILSFFSENYKILYKNQCIDFLKKYINKSQNEIIDDVITSYKTWDNYELSILYLHIFGNIIRVFSLKETFINKMLFCLIKNIHPEPLKREKDQNTLNYYNELFDKMTDWSFVNSIPQNKIYLLYENL
jgi:hypothetical protein